MSQVTLFLKWYIVCYQRCKKLDLSSINIMIFAVYTRVVDMMTIDWMLEPTSTCKSINIAQVNLLWTGYGIGSSWSWLREKCKEKD